MIRVERGPGTLTVVSRFARPRALAVLAVALGVAAALTARGSPLLAAALVAGAALVAVLGGRAVRAAFGQGRVRVSAAVPLGRPAECRLSACLAVRVETLADARRRKAERHARLYRERAGSDLPSWLRPGDQPGGIDVMRRLVLERPGEEPLALTAWLQEDDLEPARAEIAALLGR